MLTLDFDINKNNSIVIKVPFLLWITGLSGAGKTTIGMEVYNRLKERMENLIILDGDNIRNLYKTNVGYNLDDRVKSAFFICNLCKLLYDQKINIICTTMSLFKEIHSFNRLNFPIYYEVFIDVKIEELVRRNKNELYSNAISGKICDVVGIDIPFDIPDKCDLIIDNNDFCNAEDKALEIIKLIR